MTEQTQSLDVQQEHQKFIEDLGDWTRSHTCGQLTMDNDGQTVCLMGWVQYRRDHGGLIFVDLRDREGLTQVVFSPDIAPAAHENAHILRSEYVLAIKGVVRPRPEGMTNPNLVTGARQKNINYVPSSQNRDQSLRTGMLRHVGRDIAHPAGVCRLRPDKSTCVGIRELRTDDQKCSKGYSSF